MRRVFCVAPSKARNTYTKCMFPANLLQPIAYVMMNLACDDVRLGGQAGRYWDPGSSSYDEKEINAPCLWRDRIRWL